MSKRRDTVTYLLKDVNKIVYIGTTNDPKRRELEHLTEGKNFTQIIVTSIRMTEAGAKNKEVKLLERYRKNHKGKSPKFNEKLNG